MNAAFGATEAFTAGRIRVLETDLRFNKTSTGRGSRTVLGRCKALVVAGILEGRRLGPCGVGKLVSVDLAGRWESDHWGAYADERRDLADAITHHGVRNLCMISGDAPMLAIDDGSKNRFPLMAAVASLSLTRLLSTASPSKKDGRYSIGAEDGAPGAASQVSCQATVWCLRSELRQTREDSRLIRHG